MSIVRGKLPGVPKHYRILLGMCDAKLIANFTLFNMEGGGHDAPQKCFDHCAQTVKKRKLKL